MAKPKVTVGGVFKQLQRIDEVIAAEVMSNIGETVIRESKAMIAKGQSPVDGYGRFEKYKDPKKYPGKRKPASPVNLKLEGDMLDAYQYRRTAKTKLEVGVRDPKQAKKAHAHNEGTADIPQRRFIPGEGESFAKPITRKVIDIIDRRMKLLIRQAEKKK